MPALMENDVSKAGSGPRAVPGGEVNALLGRGSEFEGKLTFVGTVRIDGKFVGDVISEGRLIIGEGAKVKAEIVVDTVVVQGEVHGNIKAKAGVELLAPGRLRGNIQTPSLSVERGAIFNGNTVMEDRDGASRPVVPTVVPAPGPREPLPNR